MKRNTQIINWRQCHDWTEKKAITTESKNLWKMVKLPSALLQCVFYPPLLWTLGGWPLWAASLGLPCCFTSSWIEQIKSSKSKRQRTEGRGSWAIYAPSTTLSAFPYGYTSVGHFFLSESDSRSHQALKMESFPFCFPSPRNTNNFQMLVISRHLTIPL